MTVRTPDQVIDIIVRPVEYHGIMAMAYSYRRKGDIEDWIMLGDLDASYRVKVYLKVRP